MELKKCSMCGEYLPLSSYRWQKHKNTYYYYCKKCNRLYNKEYKRIYRERKKAHEKVQM